MSVKLFGNSRAPRLQKDVKKKTKTKTKRTVLDRIVSLLLVLVTLEALYCTAAFSNIPFIADLRTRYIATAWETMNHRWLATAFFPPAVVKAVTDQMAATQEAQIGVNSNWGQGSKQDITQPAAEKEEEPEDVMPEDQKAFFEMFSEIDVDSMQTYVKRHPEVVARGWDKININESATDSDGVDILTTQGDHVLALNAKDGVLLIRVTGSGYRGVLALAKDPSRVSIQVASSLGSYGEVAGDIAQQHDGILAMTASGFIDNGNRFGFTQKLQFQNEIDQTRLKEFAKRLCADFGSFAK